MAPESNRQSAVRASRPYSRHFAELVEEIARRAPDSLAIIDGELALTYHELQDRVNSLARGLYGLGVRSHSNVGLLCTNRWEWVCVALATHRLGARVAAFNTFAKAWDLGYMLEHSRADVLVCVEAFRSRDYRETLAELVPELARPNWRSERFPDLREVVLIGEAPKLPGVRPFSDVACAPGPDPALAPVSVADDAFVLYTSGSSARPKAVPMQHYGAIENGFQIGERMELGPDDRVLVSVPLFWAYGAINALPATLTHGGALVLQLAFEAAGALELIRRHRCTAIYTLPNMTDALLTAAGSPRTHLASLRTGLTYGTEAELRRAAEELGAAQICNIYGSTEIYGNCCVTPASWPLERRATGQGPPLPGVQLRIVDQESGETLAPGSVGEIHVRGYLARGYLDETSGANAAFGPDGWYRSGDLGSLDEEGALHFSSRATEMIKTGGINVAPREIEEFLAMHPAVENAAVVGVPDPALSEVVVAFVTVRDGEELTEAELRGFCSERIAAYKVPARVHVVDEFPATDTGKLARRRLVEIDQEVRSTA
jgi:fatty-acyl-CoA synthase